MKQRLIWSAILLAVLLTNINAQSHIKKDTVQYAPVINRAVSYGIGYSNIYDTYLSPQEYKGIDFRISRETMKMTRLWDGNISVQNFLQANISYTHNHVDNNNSFSGLLNWNYGLHYQFRISPNFKLLAGALIDANLGFIYNLRNGNNPASAKFYLNLAPSGMAIWNTKIKNYPLTLRYQVNIPVMGMMFSPHYGQSYYEIFSLGNDSGTLKFTSFHNQPSIRQFFSVDLPIKAVKLRLSYICDIQQSKINNIRAHSYTHTFMFGFVTEMCKLKPKETIHVPSGLKAY
ncbi:DUF3316 domain-containing protein [Bacteroides coprosuis]|uniref:DUF3316 domain-containing protein n=1 Tax=Bacteroides coprosuis TaxID=151276 RepID=UPI001D7C9DD1|nr:DUF3316 domain-containing protein [Bacteroides coprosuis]HJD92013.1 DUF3316 domain-containing protein [Bacteroides coprosuis]